MTRFCKDCKWLFLTPGATNLEFARCGRLQPAYEALDPVTGEIELKRPPIFCSTSRDSASMCGPEGKLFEPKEGV